MKHPKKSSPPPDDSTKDNEKPKTEPVEEENELVRRKKLLDKLFWMRAGIAAIAGFAATFLFEGFEGEERRWASIGFLIVVFIATCVIGKGMRIGLPRSDRKKIVTTGIGSFVFVYLFMWILSYTLIYHPDTGFLPKPFG